MAAAQVALTVGVFYGFVAAVAWLSRVESSGWAASVLFVVGVVVFLRWFWWLLTRDGPTR